MHSNSTIQKNKKKRYSYAINIICWYIGKKYKSPTLEFSTWDITN